MCSLASFPSENAGIGKSLVSNMGLDSLSNEELFMYSDLEIHKK